jgi:7-keto-8-aminopelargonate synthetase-like enzyme
MMLSAIAPSSHLLRSPGEDKRNYGRESHQIFSKSWPHLSASSKNRHSLSCHQVRIACKLPPAVNAASSAMIAMLSRSSAAQRARSRVNATAKDSARAKSLASLPTIRKVLEGVEARTIERINNAQINNVFVAADRFAEFVGQMNKAIEAMPAHDRLKSYVRGS